MRAALVTRCFCLAGTVIAASAYLQHAPSSLAKRRRATKWVTKFSSSSGANPQQEQEEWCLPTPPSFLMTGVVLVADPRPFFQGWPSLMSRFSLPEDEGLPRDLPADSIADLLPVVILLQKTPQSGWLGATLNRRTTALMGDLMQISAEDRAVKAEDVAPFAIQPIWQGGVAQTGLCMLHTYGEIDGALPITEDELFLGGDLASAAAHVRSSGSSWNFRFFSGLTPWAEGELETEVKRGVWKTVRAGKMSLLKPRDRKGPDKTFPLWRDLVGKAALAAEDEAESKSFSLLIDLIYNNDEFE